MTVRGTIIGEDTLSVDGITLRTDVAGMCKELLKRGHDPGERLELYRGEMLCLIVRSIAAGADPRKSKVQE